MKIGAPPTLDDARATALFAGACAFLLAFSATFVGTATASDLTLPWYEPLERRWEMAAVAPTPVAMDWFARVGLSLAAAAIAGGAVYLGTRRRSLPPALLRAAWIWSLGMTVLGLFLYAWALGTRTITPPP